jgi:hypothetical protein
LPRQGIQARVGWRALPEPRTQWGATRVGRDDGGQNGTATPGRPSRGSKALNTLRPVQIHRPRRRLNDCPTHGEHPAWVLSFSTTCSSMARPTFLPGLRLFGSERPPVVFGVLVFTARDDEAADALRSPSTDGRRCPGGNHALSGRGRYLVHRDVQQSCCPPASAKPLRPRRLTRALATLNREVGVHRPPPPTRGERSSKGSRTGRVLSAR